MKKTAQAVYKVFYWLQYGVALYLLWNAWGSFSQNWKNYPSLLTFFFLALILGQMKVPLNPERTLWLSLSDTIYFAVLFSFPPGVVIWFVAITHFFLYASFILTGVFKTRSMIFPMVSNFIICFGLASFVFQRVAGGNLGSALIQHHWLAFLGIFLVWAVVVGFNVLNVAITFASLWKSNLVDFVRSLPDFNLQGDFISTFLGALLAVLYQKEPMTAFLVGIPLVIFALSNEAYTQITLEFSKLMEVLLKALESTDPSGYSHSQRVALYAKEISMKMGHSQEVARQIYELALIHNLGTLVIPDSILFKPSGLSLLEWEVVKQHPFQTSQFVKHLPRFKKNLFTLEAHHERLDGFGYPRGLKKDEIPLVARIIAVADAYDAMTNDRPFRKKLSKEIALRRIWMGRGKQFDADAVLGLFQYLEEEPPSRVPEESLLWIITSALGVQMGLSPASMDDLHEAVILHELNPPRDIFSKPGESNTAWWQIDYREHIGVTDGLRRDFPTSEEALKILWTHHEWFSEATTTGLPVESRVLAVAEAFASCIASGMDWPLAVVRIKERVGTQFDPEAVNILEVVLAKGKIPLEALLGIPIEEQDQKTKKIT
jgi:HD-GYP domain-containing protein (c-di-GMP phosphodiesterase class II)